MIIITLQLILAQVFAISGVTKVIHRSEFKNALTQLGFLQRYTTWIASIITFLELLVVFLILLPPTTKIGAATIVGLLSLFSLFLLYNLLRGNKVPCACFAVENERPIGWHSLVRNTLIAIPAMVILLWQKIEFTSLFIQLSLLVIVTVGVTIWFLFKRRWPSSNEDKHLDRRVEERSLPVISSLPSFSLPTTKGSILTSEALISKGKPAILLFLDPRLLACQRLLASLTPRLQVLQQDYTVQIISRRSLGENLRMAGNFEKANIAVQADFEVATAFDLNGVPAMILMTSDGRVTRRVTGEDFIRSMFEDDRFPLYYLHVQEHITEENAIKSIETFPEIELRNEAGKLVPITDSHANQTLLLFWSPYCTACHGLPEQLNKEFSTLTSPPRIIVITPTGDKPDFNFDEVVIDRDFRIGKQLSVPGTPTAILIEEKTRLIASRAVGTDRVLQLVKQIALNQSALFVMTSSAISRR